MVARSEIESDLWRMTSIESSSRSDTQPEKTSLSRESATCCQTEGLGLAEGWPAGSVCDIMLSKAKKLAGDEDVPTADAIIDPKTKTCHLASHDHLTGNVWATHVSAKTGRSRVGGPKLGDQS